MNFNFTDEDLRNADAKPIFNGGKAGVAENVTVTMEEQGVDGVPAKTNSNAPDFKVYFTDSDGNKVSKACFSIDPNDYPNQWGKEYEPTMKKEWAYLNKLVEHTGGTIVMSFEDDKDLYSKIKAAMGSKPVNVFVNYGNKNNPKAFLEPRKWLPAVESVGTSKEDSILTPTNIDAMSPVVADQPAAEQSWL